MSIETEVQLPETDAIIELFELDLTALGDQVYYFVMGFEEGDAVTWRGNVYVPADFEASGFELNGRGEAPQPTVAFSVTNQMLSGLINDYNDLIGARVTRTKTFKKFLDGEESADPTAHFPLDIYRVERKTKENKFYVEFELSSLLDQQGRLLPARTISANYCPWIYRRHNGGSSGNPLTDFKYHPSDNKCPYIGNQYFDMNDQPVSASEDRCGKRVSSCKKRFGKDAELPYGGFPGASRPTIS